VTSWISPNPPYEAALSAFVHDLLGRRESNLFLDDLQANTAVIAWHGALNGLTMAVVKTLSPGVPDYYQGHEAIELSMVDPDNRRPVDFEHRRALLERAREVAALPERGGALRDWLAHAVDGRAKFWVTWRALQLRREQQATLERSSYVPLQVHGEHADRAIAFARRDGPRWLIVVGTRLSAAFGLPVGETPLGQAWGDTSIAWPPTGTALCPEHAPPLVDAISGARHAGGTLQLASILREFPVAALSGEEPGAHDEQRRADARAA
jgi:(1->4)-alpha-D-glucan 1-alpha-D-glucosylmutase